MLTKTFFVESEPYDIAVIIPTRGRTAALKRSIDSLIDTAHNISSVIFMIGVDDDDQETLSFYTDVIVPEFERRNLSGMNLTFKRLGYHNLHVYANTLIEYAPAQWMLFWNDDAIMDTPNWDQKIMEYRDQFALLAVNTNNNHPHSVFPIFPKDWWKLLGHASPHMATDGWMSEIGYMLDIVHFIDVTVIHDRFDLTGNNKDDTYDERIIFTGNPEDPADINHFDWVVRRHAEAEKIAWYMKKIGMDVSWYTRVKAGLQDPWEKLKQHDPNNQVHIYNVTG